MIPNNCLPTPPPFPFPPSPSLLPLITMAAKSNLVTTAVINYNSMAEQGREGQGRRVVGNYELGATIGEGTFGKVKAGVHVLTRERVAIKILVKEKIIDVADVERVSREIHILKLIRHPSVIQLYEIIETARHLFLIMEYVEQGELFDLIVRNGRLPEPHACRLFKHLVSAVAYLHQLNIVHRDLKPENLLIDWKGGLKVVDFGLSNTYCPGELLKTACGSPCYAAPEMISSKRYRGLDVDVWSCGVILFAMVCGYLPFEDANTALLYKKILSGEYVLPEGVSPAFRDLLSRILCVEPGKRAKIEEIFAHEWCGQVSDLSLQSGIVVGYHRIPVDRAFLQELSAFGLDPEHAERCIEANKHDHTTTTYYLLLKKHLRAGSRSAADIASPAFDYASIQPYKRPPAEKKFAFFGEDRLDLQNADIRLSANSPHRLYDSTAEARRGRLQADRSSSHLPEREQGPRKANDLRMYLRGGRQREMQSEAKQRQERRAHAQSLHFEGRHEREGSAVRVSTEYLEKGRRPAKSKFLRVGNNQRFTTNKELKEKAF